MIQRGAFGPEATGRRVRILFFRVANPAAPTRPALNNSESGRFRKVHEGFHATTPSGVHSPFMASHDTSWWPSGMMGSRLLLFGAKQLPPLFPVGGAIGEPQQSGATIHWLLPVTPPSHAGAVIRPSCPASSGQPRLHKIRTRHPTKRRFMRASPAGRLARTHRGPHGCSSDARRNAGLLDNCWLGLRDLDAAPVRSSS